MNERVKATTCLSFAMLIWGYNFVNTKIALAEFDPFALFLFRHLFSTALFVLTIKLTGKKLSKTVRTWLRVFPLALLGIVANQGLFLVGLHYTTPSHSALMYTLLPIFTALCAGLIIKEKINAFRWAGILVAFVGAFILATEGQLTLSSKYMLGDMLTLGAVIAFALFLVLAKPVLQELGVIRTLTMAQIISLPLVALICGYSAIKQDWTGISFSGWFSAFYLILLATWVGYLFHQYALKRLPAAVVAAFAYSQPALAAIFSVIILNENLPPGFFISALLIFIGIILARTKSLANGNKF